MTYTLEQLERLVKELPEGPWFVNPRNGLVCNGDPDDDRDNYPIDDPGADDFLAAARTAVPELLARVRELEQALREARGMLDVAMRNDLPGWSDGERTEMIRANPGIRIIDAALEAKP